jgi:hypothetical protein
MTTVARGIGLTVVHSEALPLTGPATNSITVIVAGETLETTLSQRNRFGQRLSFLVDLKTNMPQLARQHELVQGLRQSDKESGTCVSAASKRRIKLVFCLDALRKDLSGSASQVAD